MVEPIRGGGELPAQLPNPTWQQVEGSTVQQIGSLLTPAYLRLPPVLTLCETIDELNPFPLQIMCGTLTKLPLLRVHRTWSRCCEYCKLRGMSWFPPQPATVYTLCSSLYHRALCPSQTPPTQRCAAARRSRASCDGRSRARPITCRWSACQPTHLPWFWWPVALMSTCTGLTQLPHSHPSIHSHACMPRRFQ